MESCTRQRSISLSQPHSTTPALSRVEVPTPLPDALGCRLSAAGGQRATISTFPQILLTREATCTWASDPGTSESTLTPADILTYPYLLTYLLTYSPLQTPHGHPRVQGIFPTSVAKLPMVGPWFTTPWQLVSQPHVAVVWRFCYPIPCHVPFHYAASCHWPNPCVPWFFDPTGLLCGPCHTPILAPGPIPYLIPCLYPTGPPATQCRGPTGSSSIRGPFHAPCSGRSYPIPFCRALGAFSSACSCPGRLATCPKSWPHWPTGVLAQEHSVSMWLWPAGTPLHVSPLGLGGEVCSVFCMLAPQVVSPSSTSSFEPHMAECPPDVRPSPLLAEGLSFCCSPPYLAQACCCVSDPRSGSCRVGYREPQPG